MNKTISQPTKKGDQVAYYNAKDQRRVGVVQGWRDGKVVVLHRAGYTDLVPQADLYLLD
ncbi:MULTISPECIES: hypothetical protein [unclassified Cupriavidus]|uniref:hypothetical protein n=1 Tax=unclassified Cupriavidus TaxID=2640874 RepID=UPI00313AC961